jgi:hypothetical protein
MPSVGWDREIAHPEQTLRWGFSPTSNVSRTAIGDTIGELPEVGAVGHPLRYQEGESRLRRGGPPCQPDRQCTRWERVAERRSDHQDHADEKGDQPAGFEQPCSPCVAANSRIPLADSWPSRCLLVLLRGHGHSVIAFTFLMAT